MNAEAKTVTRKGSPPIKVYCLPEERGEIEAMAKASGHKQLTEARIPHLSTSGIDL